MRPQERSGDIPPRVARWAEAHCSFDVAERRAIERKAAKAVPPLMRALALDPLRSGLRVAARLTSAARRIRGAPPLAQRPHFYDAGTAEPIEAPGNELGAISDLIHQVDARRMRQLSASEALSRRSTRGS